MRGGGTGREWNREVGCLKSTWPRTQNSDKTPKTPKRPETSTPEHRGEGGILPPPWGLSPAPSSRGRRGETGCGPKDGLDLTVPQLPCGSEQVPAFFDPLD